MDKANRNSMKQLLFILITLGTTALTVQAQIPKEGETLDRVLAVVGKEIVLKSEVDGQMFMLAQQNKNMDFGDEKLRRRVLDALINDRLLYNKALEDSIQVTEEEITAQTEAQLQQMIAQVGSEQRLVDVYAMPMWKIRRDMREVVRKNVMMERVRQSRLYDLKASAHDVEEFYKEFKDSMPQIGEQVELAHIVLYIKPSSESKDKAQQLAKKVYDSIAAGGDFCDFAKRYSSDPGSATTCGELGMRNATDFVIEYSSAAKKLQIGELSPPVESPFGFHLIQLLDRTKDQIKTRHILFQVSRQDNDIELVKKNLNAIKEGIAQGKKSFEDAAKISSEEKETQGFGGSLGKTQIQNLEAQLRTAVEKLPDGGVTEPLPYVAERTKPAMHIVLRKRTIPAHTPSLESDYKELERMATSYKQNKEYENWMKDLRKQMYWTILD